MRATLPTPPRPADRGPSSEREFYALYDWCLNPILSLDELFLRLREELDRYPALRVGWQRQESAINLYLFICAIACTVDDYLAWRPWNLSAIVARFPRFRRAVALAQVVLNAPWSVRQLIGESGIVRWRRGWGRCVDHVCEMLVRRELPARDNLDDTQPDGELRMMVHALTTSHLPPRLLRQRMRLPEGFRCQDLTHHDVFALAKRFASGQAHPGDRLAVIGPRTAGAYFAPLTKAYLAAYGWSQVSWMTIRPKMGASWREWRELRAITGGDARVLLVDDYPNTGATFTLMLGVLRRLRVPLQRITVLAPHHPAEGGRPLLKEAGVTVIGIEPEELYKARLLGAGSAEARLREYYADWDTGRIQQSGPVEAVNARLQAHYADGFHVRLKRLFQLERTGKTAPSSVRHLFVKSVGWGWLGYHAYIAGVRLADCVPPVVGLRDGLLLTDWVGDIGDPQPGLPRADRVQTLSAYIVKRAHRLRLAGDPCFGTTGYRWHGWDEIVTILRGAYGPYVGRLKVPALRRQLAKYLCPVPMMVDGQMRPDEWIATPTGICKVDFEHHNFGGAEKDIVDPAWDLAAAIFECALSDQEERELLHTYARDSDDHTIFNRIVLYYLLYGTHSMNFARQAIARQGGGEDLEHWNQRYLRARAFLASRTNRVLAESARRSSSPAWTKRLFFLDLDGVLDCERLGFPHTTPCGLAALALLRAHDFSVVPNTGRSVEDVRDSCHIHGLPGGLAEYGSVFVDAVAQCEVPLIDPTAAEQLARCRDAIAKIPGVFTDDGYRYSIRVYRWHGARPAALDAHEAQELLRRCRADKLTIIPRLTDSTHIVQTGISKGAAMTAVRARLGCASEPAGAIGDSDQDIDALELASFSYAPANCSRAIRDLAKRNRCRVMTQSFQRGLLAAVRDLLSRAGQSTVGAPHRTPERESTDLLRALACVVDRPLLAQVWAVLDWRGL